jgi:hypothetical protein
LAERSNRSGINELRSPLLGDYDRWQRAVFDFNDWMAFQRMDDSFARYGAAINDNDKTIAFTKEKCLYDSSLLGLHY